MQKYRLELTKRAMKDLAKLDKPTQALIVKWLQQNLQDTTTPRSQGKALTGATLTSLAVQGRQLSNIGRNS